MKTESQHLDWNTFLKHLLCGGSVFATQSSWQYSCVSSYALHCFILFLRRQLELINVQPRDSIVYPNILKLQNTSGRSPCAALVGLRANKCKICVGSVPQLCALGLMAGFVITPQDAKLGLLEKNEATSLQDHQQVGASC